RDVRFDAAGRDRLLARNGLRGLDRHPDLGLRHVDVPGAQRHGPAWAQGLVAGPRRPAGRAAARARRAPAEPRDALACRYQRPMPDAWGAWVPSGTRAPQREV